MSEDYDAKEFGERLDMARDEMEELREWDARKPEVQARVLRTYAKKFLDDQEQRDLIEMAQFIADGEFTLQIEEAGDEPRD